MEIRRSWIVLNVLGISGLVIGGCAAPQPAPTSSSQPSITISPLPTPEVTKIELKLAHFLPAGSTMAVEWLDYFANEASKLSDDNISVRVFPAETLAKGEDLLDSILTGISDIALVPPMNWPDRFPLNSFGELPYVYPAPQVARSILTAQQEGVLGKEAERLGFKVVSISCDGPRMLMNNIRQVKSVADAKGLKIGSIGGGETEQLKKLGMRAFSMDVSGAITGVKTGTIDGFTNTFLNVRVYGFMDLMKYFTEYGSNHYSLMFIGTGLNLWNKLTPQQQQILIQAGKNAGNNWASTSKKEADAAIQALVNNPKVQYYQVTGTELVEWKQAVKNQVPDWIKAHGADGEAVYADYQNILKKMGLAN